MAKYGKKKLKPNASKSIVIRVTPDELFQIKRLAKIYADGNVSKFLKQKALSTAQESA